MIKKLEKILEKTGISVEKNDTFHHGRYTVVELTDSKGHIGVGISRQSDLDDNISEMGQNIARGRAERALYNKLMNRKIHNPLMG